MQTKANLEFFQELSTHVGVQPIHIQSMMNQKPIGRLTIGYHQTIESQNQWVTVIRQRYPELNSSVFSIIFDLYHHKKINPHHQGWIGNLTLKHYKNHPLYITAYLADSMEKTTVILNDILLNTIFQGLLDQRQYGFTQRQSLISIIKEVTQLSNKDIAKNLFLSPETVKSHLKIVRQKKTDHMKYTPIIVPTPLGTILPF